MSLIDFGWNEQWAERLAVLSRDGAQDSRVEAARVVAEHRGVYRVRTESAEIAARVAGRLRHSALSAADLPAVGDWVAVEVHEGEARIQAVLPRASVFSRKMAGKRTDEQVVGANIDTVWIVLPLDSDRNAARIERYLTLVWESGASPAVILTKTDLVDAPEAILADLSQRIMAVPIHLVSAVDGTGIDELQRYLAPGATVALLGPSGAGKSTLINLLARQEVMRTADVREGDGKGRHTTTHRQLVLLSSGGLLLDTPGMRELQLWSRVDGAKEGLGRGFADIDELATECRFSDCLHESEPGCAVQGAIADGDLAPERLESFRKLQKETAYLERRQDLRADLEERNRWKQITKEYRRWSKKNR